MRTARSPRCASRPWARQPAAPRCGAAAARKAVLRAAALPAAPSPVSDGGPTAMLPIVALVGRPNVGKSTLFNMLTGTRDAIVADVPGVTRDRQYGYGRAGEVSCVVVDTGGVVTSPRSTIEQQMREQTQRAIAEADRLIFVVDGRTGP